MRITRTANAGILLELDGKRILLDGVCREVSPYPATSCHIRRYLLQNPPDLVAFTHFHDDHYDPDFEKLYKAKTGSKVITAENAGQTVKVGDISLTAVSSRHIGKADCDHVSFFIKGSKSLWFMGDAAPVQWKKSLYKADILIAPFAYATTEAAWRISREIAQKTVILHLPEAGRDSLGLCDAVRQTVGEYRDVFVPEMEEFIQMDF